MAKRERAFVGLHCGPCADGAEGAAVAITGRGGAMKVRQVHVVRYALAAELRQKLRSIAGGWAASAAELAGLDRDMGEFLAGACRGLMKEAGLAARDVAAAGLIGLAAGYAGPESPPLRERTRGGPSRREGAVLELGSPTVISARTGLAIISGFAASDLAAGGVGGPVTAWPDWLIFRDDRLSRTIVRLGGIATVTLVGTAAEACDVVAFDAAPGTIIIDEFMRRLLDSPMDEDGAVAARGTASPELVHELMSAEFFRKRPPKAAHASLWGETAIARLEMMAARRRCSGEDLIASVTELTARVVARDILAMTERPHEVILAGGGARNIHLAGRIRALLSPSSTYTTERYGFDVLGHNAACAAVLAAARLDAYPAHCHAATGAARPVLLGSVTAV